MLGINEMNQELVRAFNINLCYNDIAITNLTVQSLHGKDHIVISFDKNMDSKQCMKYLNNMKEKIIKRSYRDEKAAGVSYNLKFFPFAFNTKHLPRDDKGRKKFSVEIDEGVFFNLKCYLAQALAGDVTEGMGKKRNPEYLRKHMYDASFDRNSYLYCMLFHDKGLQKDFVDLFSAEIEGYPNPPSDYLEEKGNLVYIRKSIFDDIEFIKDIIAYNASLECRYLQTPSAKNKTVDKLKYTMIDLIDRAADLPVRTITRTSYVNRKEDSVLIPLVQNGKFLGFLSKDDAYDLNRTFGDAVVTRIESRRLKNPYWSSDYVYAIDFADADISYCVLNKIIESSVINKDHELSIDPELHFRALSRSPSTKLSDTEWESPTWDWNQDRVLEDDDSISLNLGVSEDSPKDTENICNEEPEEQQVTDKSESPEKKHGGGLFCKKGMPILAKLSPLKRRGLKPLTSDEELLYLKHTLLEKRELSRFQYDKAQLFDNSSSKRDSGYSSGLPASPAVPHKESVSSEVKECRTVEHTRETWGKRI